MLRASRLRDLHLLVAIPEGALQGFNDEILDVDHADFARNCAIDIPWPETEELAKIAKEFDVYLMAQAKARHEDWPDLFFNVGFVLDPDGDVILKHYKLNALLPVERSVSPHDLFDWWIEKYGRTLDAFWPVADTDIGRMGIMMAMEGNYPENGRGLALNGAEIVYRASLPAPMTQNDMFEISTLIEQEVSIERYIDVPGPVLDVYRLWRPTPLYRARRLETALKTPARIYYKYEGVSAAGSHKPNTAVAQAYYNKQEGVARLTTETGAGQWGSALACTHSPLSRSRG